MNAANYINIAAYVVNFAITYISMTGAFGETNSAVSNKYQTLITPAGWAFSIWGLIFLAEGVFSIAQLFPKYRNSVFATNPYVVAGWLLASLFQISWTLAFAQEAIWISAILLTLIWVSLGVVVYAHHTLLSDSQNTGLSTKDYSVLVFPFRVHFAWVTAATFVSYNLIPVRYHASDATLQLGCAIASLVALAFLAGLLRTNHVLSAVLSWAIGAVASELSHPKNSITQLFGGEVVHGVRGACIAVSVALAALTIVGLVIDAVRPDATENQRLYIKPLL